MARVGVGPGVAEPIPGRLLSVGETLTKEREDLLEFMGCRLEVLDDLEDGAAGETVKVKIIGMYEDGSEMASYEVLSGAELEAARKDAVLARKADTEFQNSSRNSDCGSKSNSVVSTHNPRRVYIMCQ